MSVSRPENFSLSFPNGTRIGDCWWGNGIWNKPLDLPAGLSYWTFINVNGADIPADSGYWATLPEGLSLGSYCNGASNEYYSGVYGTAYILQNWGSGFQDWDLLVQYATDYYSWIWGDIDSGMALMRTGNNSYRFLSTYGRYENANGDVLIAATESSDFTREQLEAGAFTWYTNKTTQNDGSTADNAVYWFCKNINYGYDPLLVNTYVMTDYEKGWILYASEYGVDVAGTFTDGTTSTALGGNFPNLTISLNSANSPYAGPGGVYWPDTVVSVSGYELVSGGSFPGSTDTSGDSSHTPSDSAGGDGNYDNSSDTIGFPDEDQFAIDVLNSGFISVFNPTKNEIIDFADFLYSDSITDAIATQLKRLLADPLDYIIGLNMAHFRPETGGNNTINFGGVSSGVTSAVVDPQIQFLDCGEVEIPEQTNSFQDYIMSKISIYLPYCGLHELSISECMGGSIWVQYIIDTVTGSCVANVRIRRHRTDIDAGDPNLDSILYSFTGNCFQSVPLTSRDFKTTIQSLLTVAGAVGTVAAAGIPAGMAAGGGLIAAGKAAGKAAVGQAGNVANAALNATPSVSRIGNYSSNFGYMQKQKPYVILERPVASVPSGYEGYYGRPLYNNLKLSSCYGYTEVDIDTFWILGDGFDGITKEEEDILKAELNADGLYIDHNSEYSNYEP